MRRANDAILRERHSNPTVDDVIHALNGATMFSKLDLRSGYHQIVLHDDSRYITAFSTHCGVKQSTFSRIPAAQPRATTILEADWLDTKRKESLDKQDTRKQSVL